jgi:uncharacterized membrane protein YphA (DoxX/SURF4 family)
VTRLALLAGRFHLATLFLLASLAKVPPGRLANTIESYGLLPQWAVGPASLLVIVGEFAIGFCLGVGLVVPVASGAAAIFLLTFSVGVALVLIRGDHPPCGCLGADERATWMVVVRDLLLCALAVGLATRTPHVLEVGGGATTTPSATDAIAMIVVGSLLVLVVLTAAEARRALLVSSQMEARHE